MQKIKFTILGSGTSSGVPTIACECPTCKSDDIKDKRLRCSLLIESPDVTIVIDTSSDFRQQMLNYNVKKLDAVIYTHHHFDHIGGFDDLRAFNFKMDKPISIYASEITFNHLKRVYDYAFSEPEQIGGGVPAIDMNVISNQKFKIKDIEITPIPLFHGKLGVLGFRIGNFAYCTDTNLIPNESLDLLKDLNTLVLDGLRIEKHPTHFTIKEAIEIIDILKPKKSYLTHICHSLKHCETEKNLPQNVYLAYDGIKFEL